MAFPFTPHRTYLANSAPPIAAADLADYEAYFGHIFGGTKSIKCMVLDGVGDQTQTTTDLLTLANTSGDVTGIVDSYGFPYNSAPRIYEDWLRVPGSSSRFNSLVSATGANTAKDAYATYASVGNWPYNYLQMDVLANGDTAGFYSVPGIVVNHPHLIFRARFKVSIGALTNSRFEIGINKVTGASVTAGNSALMASVQTGINGGGWTMRTAGTGGSGVVITNTAIASFASVQQDIMLVLKGSSRGNSTSLYIDDMTTPAATQSTVLPIASTVAERMLLTASLVGTAGGAVASAALGPMDVSWTIE